jgi:cell division protein FtsZ
MPKKKSISKIRPKKKLVCQLGKEKREKDRKIKIRISKKSKKENIVSQIHRTKIRVIGVGGGGGSIVAEIASRIKKADFVAINTDLKALKALRRVKRFQLGRNLTQGLGTGMNVEVGEAAAQEAKEKIKKLFEGQDICIIISCLGGGTGCGATPVLAKIAKSFDCLTYGIFTLPFKFEGEKKMDIAKEALIKTKPYLNIYSVIPNERIFQIIDKNTPLKEALSAINQQLAENLEGLIEMIYSPGLINIDFADLKTILEGRGKLAYLKKTEIKQLDREQEAKKLISSRIYPYTIQGARGILYNLVGGRDLQISEVAELSKIISGSLNKNAKIVFGLNQKAGRENKIELTLLAVGSNIKGEFLKPAYLLKTEKKREAERRKKKIKREKEISVFSSDKTIKEEKVEGNVLPKTEKQTEAKENLDERPAIKKKQSPEEKNKKMKTGGGLNDFSSKKKPPSKIIRKKKSEEPSKNLPAVSRLKRQPSPDLYGKANNAVRRTGLQVKRAVEEEERELLEKEKTWETPAIFRKRKQPRY